jgi:hypothetical protein
MAKKAEPIKLAYDRGRWTSESDRKRRKEKVEEAAKREAVERDARRRL